MKRWLGLITALYVLNSSAAAAQFNIGPILDKTPVQFGFSVKVRLDRLGPNVVASASAAAALQGAQAIITAALPQLNSRLACSKGTSKSVVVNELRLAPKPTFEVGGGLMLVANVHVRQCAVGLYEGNIEISVPIGVQLKGQSILLTAGQPSVVPQGVYFRGGIIQVSDDQVVSSTSGSITPTVISVVKRLNGWVNSKLHDPSLQKFVRTYDLQIQTAQLRFQDGDLALGIELSGQTSIDTANRMISNF